MSRRCWAHKGAGCINPPKPRRHGSNFSPTCKVIAVPGELARLSALPLRVGSLWSLCVPRAQVELHPLWAPWGRGYEGKGRACINNGVSVAHLGSVLLPPQLRPRPHSSSFGLSLSSQLQFSPQVFPLKSKFQRSASARTSRHSSWAGDFSEVVWPLFCLPQACCTVLSLWSFLSVQADLLAVEGSFQGEGTFSLSQLPPRVTGPIPIPFFLPFILSSYLVIFLAILIVWDLLPAFSR